MRSALRVTCRFLAKQTTQWGTKVRRYNWHSAGSLGWPFLNAKIIYIYSANIGPYGSNFNKQHSETVMV